MNYKAWVARAAKQRMVLRTGLRSSRCENGATGNNGDRPAELKLVRLISEDNYNREVEIEAKPNGLWIDDYIVIPWDWIFQAASALHVREAPQGTYEDRCSP